MPIDSYLRGTVSFPGIRTVLGGTYTLAHGCEPGVIAIRCAPQEVNPNNSLPGDVVFQWRDTVIRLRQCRVFNHMHVGNGDGGFDMIVYLHDRRWKWQFPTISGRYNLRTADQTVYSGPPGNGLWKKHPQQLAKLLLKELGEDRVDVSALPTNDYPLVEWVDASAASELASLCDKYGCHVVKNIDESIAIRKIGEGNFLPKDLPICEENESLTVPLSPDSIEVHFGPSKFRVNTILRPVGLEVDGTIKQVNDLSYAPRFGFKPNQPFDGSQPWRGESPGTLSLLIHNLGGNALKGEKLFLIDCARRSIYRWYQIADQQPPFFPPELLSNPSDPRGEPIEVPGFPDGTLGSDTYLPQLLPIDDTLSNVLIDTDFKDNNRAKDLELAEDGAAKYATDQFWNIADFSRVWGYFYRTDRLMGGPKQTSKTASKEPESKNAYPPGGWSLDRERGIVMFNEPVYKLEGYPDGPKDTWTNNFPNLCFSFMASPRYTDTGRFHQHVVKRDFPGSRKTGTKPLVLLHPEFQLVVTHDLENGKQGPPRYLNRKMLDKIGNYYIDYAIRRLRITNPLSFRYNGLWPIQPNGAIREVTFTVGGENGAETEACYNDERSPWVQSHEERRMFERTRAGITKFGLTPPVFYAPPQSFPYNLRTTYFNISPSRRG